MLDSTHDTVDDFPANQQLGVTRGAPEQYNL